MKEKKSHGVQLLFRAVVKDPDGKVIHDTGQKPSKSFVIQFLEYFYGLFRGTSFSATDTLNAEQPLFSTTVKHSQMFRCDYDVVLDKSGIMVGTGTAALDNEDYKLQTQLTEGAGAGEISHANMIFGDAGVVGPNVDLECHRSFTNNTGSSIAVSECGVYCYRLIAPLISHCLIRDLISPAVTVPDKCSLTIYYTMRTTV